MTRPTSKPDLAALARHAATRQRVSNSVRDNCIASQWKARQCATAARRYVVSGLLGRAAQEQREAARYHREAWIRLAWLIGSNPEGEI